MRRARQTESQTNRSSIDRLADRAPPRLRHQAGAAALAADKLVTAAMRARTAATPALARVKGRPAPYLLIAIAVGAGVGALAYGPSRRAIGGAAVKLGRSSAGSVARQLGRELRSFIR